MPDLAYNKDVRRHYDILEEFEAGIALLGPEVKSVKQGHVNLAGSYASFRNASLWLRNCHISPYAFASPSTRPDPDRERRLLLSKRELVSIATKLHSEGLTIVPLRLYTKAGLIKVGLGLAKGLQKADKRAKLKKREVDRSIRAAVKRRHRS